ncbi:unnamed protein product [Mycetohabitans rhizoxinica HKI 454]|uniref:Uncharacterized protein n=1 Tax=Mycetohabitans rhizoxinica (strain DSM 19002 / CIP 109453 / HKI 454) TaxID=882378 RepID=E5ANC5_MYCRK|nr:unnamed protein product [Mycetohabitans rhizoxinica HKI 454]
MHRKFNARTRQRVVIACLMPSPMKALPTPRSSHCLTRARPDSRCVAVPAIQATTGPGQALLRR